MSVQECALYGDLVLWLRDRAAELLAEARTDSTLICGSILYQTRFISGGKRFSCSMNE
jgi:hypothetical protein